MCQAVNTFPAGTTKYPSPAPNPPIPILSVGITIDAPAFPLHISEPVVASTAKTNPEVDPTITAWLMTMGAETSPPSPVKLQRTLCELRSIAFRVLVASRKKPVCVANAGIGLDVNGVAGKLPTWIPVAASNIQFWGFPVTSTTECLVYKRPLL